MTRAKTKRIRRLRERVVASVFILMLAAPAIVQLAAPADVSEIAKIENRSASTWPAFPRTVRDLDAAPGAIGAFLDDRFGLRRSLIGLQLYLKERLDLEIGERKAIVGEDDWLFGAEAKSLELHMGRAPFRPGEAATWLEALAAIKAEATADGAVFVAMIAPQKATVYGEKLPAFARAGRRPGRREILEEGGPVYGAPFAAAAERLQDAKTLGQLYYRTDTHWTGLGAYEGYLALMARVRTEGVDAPVLARERLRISQVEDFAGDLSRLLSQDGRYREAAPRVAIAEPVRLTRSDFIDAYRYDEFQLRVVESAPNDRPTLLILGDSFALPLLPYLRESFSRVVFAHHQFGAFDRKIFDDYPSDVVVFEMTERFLTKPLAAPSTKEKGP